MNSHSPEETYVEYVDFTPLINQNFGITASEHPIVIYCNISQRCAKSTQCNWQ